MLRLWVPVPALCLPGHACVPIQHTKAVDPRCFPSDDSLPPCFSGGSPMAVYLLFKAPKTPCSSNPCHVVPCLGELLCLKTTLVNVLGQPAWLGQGQAVLAFSLSWTTAPFMSALRKPSRIIPPLPPVLLPAYPPPLFAFCERVSCPVGHPGTAGGASGQGN